MTELFNVKTQTRDSIYTTELIPNNEVVKEAYKTKNNQAFVVTDGGFYISALSQTAGWMYHLPHDHVKAFKVSHNYEAPDYSNAIVLAISGVLAMFASPFLPEEATTIGMVVGVVLLVLAVGFGIHAYDNRSESTEIKFEKPGGSYSVELDGLVGDEVSPIIGKHIK